MKWKKLGFHFEFIVEPKVASKSVTQRHNLSDRLGEYVRLSDKGKVMDILHFWTEPSYETQSCTNADVLRPIMRGGGG